MMPHIPKSILNNFLHNPNATDAQNYNIVEDLAQAPRVMSDLEVLQTFTTQRKALLIGIGAFENYSSGLITFNTENHKFRLPYHAEFQIKVSLKGTNIFRMVINEGASTSVMSLSCWKYLGSLEFLPSNALLKAFDGHTFKPHRIIPTFPVELGGKLVLIKVSVVDAPIDYNLLIG